MARAARPVPIGLAATLLVGAIAVLRAPAPAVDTATVPAGGLEASIRRLVVTGGSSEAIMDVLIAPASSDSLLARVYATQAPESFR